MHKTAEINNQLMSDYDRRLKEIADQNAKFRKKLSDANLQQLSKTNPSEAQTAINGTINTLMERLENVSRGGVK
jgi:demethoxyubiquinone hydroxylase (CLK1/Coq7/Cat5 family)